MTTLATPTPEPTGIAAVPPSPLAILSSALQSGHSAESLKELVGLVERMEDRQARKDFLADFGRFRQEVKPILKRREAKKGSETLYFFASLQDVEAVVLEPLLRFGLSYSFSGEEMDGGRLVTTCKLEHVSGYSRSSKFTGKIEGTSIMSGSQKAAANTTYGQRWALLAVLGIATEDDRGDAGNEDDKPPAPTPPPAPQNPLKPVYVRWYRLCDHNAIRSTLSKDPTPDQVKEAHLKAFMKWVLSSLRLADTPKNRTQLETMTTAEQVGNLEIVLGEMGGTV